MSRRRQSKQGVPPWLAWSLGLLALGVGLWALAWRAPSAAPPLDDIDAESREQLERVLREAHSKDEPR